MSSDLPAPEDGTRIPAVVARWAPALQVVWFSRYGEQLASQRSTYDSDPDATWEARAPGIPFDDYYVASVQHRGCCWTPVAASDACCSRSPRACKFGKDYYYRA